MYYPCEAFILFFPHQALQMNSWSTSSRVKRDVTKERKIEVGY